ncbi:unnamed protein product, partial [Eretmochelys imbricata]
MRGAVATLSLAWALALGLAHSLPGKPGEAGLRFHHGAGTHLNDTEVASRCADEGGFDAVTLDEHGVMLFFRGDHVWKGFHGPAQLINATWPEIQGPVDAALRIHHKEAPGVHDSVYLFQGMRVWAYAGGRLRPGYPRLIGDEFKGVPGDLDSAVECHPEDCTAESLLFFKGGDVFFYDLGLGGAEASLVALGQQLLGGRALAGALLLLPARPLPALPAGRGPRAPRLPPATPATTSWPAPGE